MCAEVLQLQFKSLKIFLWHNNPSQGALQETPYSNKAQLTSVEALPGPDGCLLPTTLELLLPLQVPLNLHWGEIGHVLHALVFTEALCAAAGSEAGCAFGLLQVYFHALCSLKV